MASVSKRKWAGNEGGGRKVAGGRSGESWQVSWTEEGKRRKKAGFTTRAEAELFALEKQQAVNAGTSRPEGDRMSLTQLSVIYLQHEEQRAAREAIGKGHLRNQRAHFRNYIVRAPDFQGSTRGRAVKPFSDAIGHYKLTKIKPSTVIRFRDALFAIGLGYKAVRAHLVTLRSALEWARLRDLVPTNAADKVPVDAPAKQKDARVTPPSTTAMMEVLQASPPELAEIILFSACTGLRSGELRCLRYRHIDLEKLTVRVKVALEIDDTEGPPKSKAGYRTIPISAELGTRLLTRKTAAGASAKSLVFSNDKGGYIYRGSLLKQLNKVTAGLGWLAAGDTELDADEDDEDDGNTRFTWHALRHYAISSWIAADFNLKAVQVYAGHADVNTTWNRYGHLFPQDDQSVKMASASASIIATI